jgi:peroxiredoxin Q/BCP
MKKLEIGQMAPEFSTIDDKENAISSQGLKGSNYVLYFYPKDDTPGCTIEANEFNKLHKEFNQLNCKVFGISKDSSSSHTSFKEKYCLDLPLLLDTEGSICESFNVIKEKTNFGKKYMGISRTTFLVDKEGKLAAIWENVDAFGHAGAVLEKLKTINV